MAGRLETPSQDCDELEQSEQEVISLLGGGGTEDAADAAVVGSTKHTVYDEDDPDGIEWSALLYELARGLNIAGPSVAIQLLQMFTWTLTASEVGTRLGVDELAGVSLATLAGNLTGLSIVYGALSAFDTLAPRAVGLQQHEQLGLLAQRATVLCLLLLAPACVVWYNVEPLLLAVGQPHQAVRRAGYFLRVYIFSLPSLVGMEITRRFCLVQGVVRPFVAIGVLWLALHYACLRIGLAQLGFLGAPLAHVISQTGALAITLLCACNSWCLVPCKRSWGCRGGGEATKQVPHAIACTDLRVRKPHHPDSWRGGWQLGRALAPMPLWQYCKLGIPGVASMGEWCVPRYSQALCRAPDHDT